MSGPGKKKIPRGDQGEWIRDGGAIGDLSMEQADKYSRDGAGVDCSYVENVGDSGGDPNDGVSLGKRLPGAEA